MQNPWAQIPLSTYEAHMESRSVQQLPALNRLMKKQLELSANGPVMIQGLAGGNGLEHVEPQRISKLYGIDINAEYLAAARNRYPQLAGTLECLQADLRCDVQILPAADLLIADLLIEYIGLSRFRDIVRQVRPRCISCVIQAEATSRSWISPSPYARTFDGLNQIHQDIAEEDLENCLSAAGFSPSIREAALLPEGRQLIRRDFSVSRRFHNLPAGPQKTCSMCRRSCGLRKGRVSRRFRSAGNSAWGTRSAFLRASHRDNSQ